MNDELPGAKIISLGLADEKFAADFDRMIEQELSDPEELQREDERLFEEGRRLMKGFSESHVEAWEDAWVFLRAIEHRNRWAGKSSADRARESETTDEACAWQLIAALPELLEQAGFVPRAMLAERSQAAALVPPGQCRNP